MKSYRKTLLCALLCASLLMTASCTKKEDPKTPGSDSQSDSVQNVRTDVKTTDTEAQTTPQTDAQTEPQSEEEHIPTETEKKPQQPTETEQTETPAVENPDSSEQAGQEENPPAKTQTEQETDNAGSALSAYAGMTDSGRFVSEESKNLKLIISWDYEILEDGVAEVCVNIGISHYRLFAKEKINWGAVQVDGNAQQFTTPEIQYDNEALHFTPFYSAVYTTDRPTMEVEASWKVLGTYAGQEIDSLTAGGTITFGENEN